jgi:hypothetical protein
MAQLRHLGARRAVDSLGAACARRGGDLEFESTFLQRRVTNELSSCQVRLRCEALNRHLLMLIHAVPLRRAGMTVVDPRCIEREHSAPLFLVNAADFYRRFVRCRLPQPEQISRSLANSLRGYLRRLRLSTVAAPTMVDVVLRLGAMDHGCAPCLSQQPAPFFGSMSRGVARAITVANYGYGR